MLRLLTSSQARELDRRAAAAGITGLAQMEAAAAKACAVVLPLLGTGGARVMVLCGRGNNGGDGIALARHLRSVGVPVEVHLPAGAGDAAMPPEAAANLAVWTASGGDVMAPERTPGYWASLAASLQRRPVLIIDALLGIGQTKPPHGAVARAVEMARAARDAVGGLAGVCRCGAPALEVQVLALDIPTGLCADTGRAFEPHLAADVTVTFGLPKVGLFTGDGPGLCGEVVLASLGWPDLARGPATAGLIPDVPETWLMTAAHAGGLLPLRSAGAHKGDAGRVLAVAGSGGMAGAAALTAMGAVRGGAGLVTVAVPASEQAAVNRAVPEAMTWALPTRTVAAGAPGALELDPDAAAAALARAAAATGAGVIAAGPGMGRSAGATAVLVAVIEQRTLPLVLDADGLNAFAAGELPALVRRPGDAPLVITPHPGELARIAGGSPAAVQADRLAAARGAAAATGAICLLKGRGTVVAAPGDGTAWVIPAGNPGMATGGMGDVLTGVVAAHLAGWATAGAEPASLLARVTAAAMLHSLAGDIAAAELGPVGLRASDVAERLPAAYRLCLVAAGRAPANPGDVAGGTKDTTGEPAATIAPMPAMAARTPLARATPTAALPAQLARSLKGVTMVV